MQRVTHDAGQPFGHETAACCLEMLIHHAPIMEVRRIQAMGKIQDLDARSVQGCQNHGDILLDLSVEAGPSVSLPALPVDGSYIEEGRDPGVLEHQGDVQKRLHFPVLRGEGVIVEVLKLPRIVDVSGDATIGPFVVGHLARGHLTEKDRFGLELGLRDGNQIHVMEHGKRPEGDACKQPGMPQQESLLWELIFGSQVPLGRKAPQIDGNDHRGGRVGRLGDHVAISLENACMIGELREEPHAHTGQ